MHVVVADALRPGDELRYHPGETVLRMADIVVVNKVNAASGRDVEAVEANARALAPNAAIVRAASPVTLDDVAAVKGRRVLVIEDGPTITHGPEILRRVKTGGRRHPHSAARLASGTRPDGLGAILDDIQPKALLQASQPFQIEAMTIQMHWQQPVGVVSIC